MDYDDESGIEEQSFKVIEDDDDLLVDAPIDMPDDFDELDEDPEDKYH